MHIVTCHKYGAVLRFTSLLARAFVRVLRAGGGGGVNTLVNDLNLHTTRATIHIVSRARVCLESLRGAFFLRIYSHPLRSLHEVTTYSLP